MPLDSSPCFGIIPSEILAAQLAGSMGKCNFCLERAEYGIEPSFVQHFIGGFKRDNERQTHRFLWQSLLCFEQMEIGFIRAK